MINISIIKIITFLTCLHTSFTQSDPGEYLDIKDCLVEYSTNDTHVECSTVNLNIRNLRNLIGFNETLKYDYIKINKKQLHNLSEPIFVNYNIKQLNLLKNQIAHINNETFRYIKGLQLLKLDNNLIGEDSFRSLVYSPMASKSIKLHISGNQIGQLSKIIPWSFSNTTSLYIESNNINYLCDYAFENLKKLEILDLSSNALVELRTKMFANLTSLFLLNLNSNNLKTIESFTFANIPGLLNLFMANNELKTLDETTFGSGDAKLVRFYAIFNLFDKLPKAVLKSARSLSQLQLVGNPMSMFDFGLIANMSSLTYLNLAMCKIDRLAYGDINSNYSLSFLDKIFLTYSNLNEFDFSFVVDYLTGLKELYLSYNQLKKVSFSRISRFHKSINTLSLDNNLISELIPFNFQPFSSMSYLFLQQNLIKTLPSQTFKGLVALIDLDLSRNIIESVASNAFDGLSQLITLNLSYNRIRAVNEDTLRGMVSLQNLDFSWNKLESIKRLDFKSVRSLVKLVLSNNFIISIEPYSFANMVNLKKLILDRNYLTNLQNFTFAMLPNLDVLSLVSNCIQRFEAFSFADSTIFELDLGSNCLVSFPTTNTNNFVKVISLSNNKLVDFIMLPFHGKRFESEVEKIDLSINKIMQVRFENEQFGSIYAVDLSWNLIESISIDDFKALVNLIDLDLSNNRLKNIEQGFFAEFKFQSLKLNDSLSEVTLDINQLGSNLTEIDLSFNRMADLKSQDGGLLNVLRLVNVHFELNETSLDFEKYTQLTTLDLSFNKLKFNLNRLNALSNLKRLYLKSTGLQSLENVNFYFSVLEEINLAQNDIRTITIDFFRLLKSLQLIDLSFNRIEYVDENLFDDFLMLKQLHLEHNQIVGLFILPFTKFCDEINLSFNNLSQFTRPVDMDELDHLQRLDLSHNRLSTVDFDSFFDSQNGVLTTLLLNDNSIDVLSVHTFNQMIQLRQLNLRNNLLRTLDKETFAYLMTLEWLDLSENQLTLQSNLSIFDSLVRLKHLNLSFNQIEHVSEQLFARLFYLKELDLSSNRLKGIEPYSLSNLSQLTYLDLSNNSLFTLEENSLFGLDSIKDVWISFDQLTKNNQFRMIYSLKTIPVRNVDDVIYFKSIYVNYAENKVDCFIVLDFIRFNIQLKLRTDQDYLLFLNYCYSFIFSS